MQRHYYELLPSGSDLHFNKKQRCVRYKLFSMDVYLRIRIFLPSKLLYYR